MSWNLSVCIFLGLLLIWDSSGADAVLESPISLVLGVFSFFIFALCLLTSVGMKCSNYNLIFLGEVWGCVASVLKQVICTSGLFQTWGRIIHLPFFCFPRLDGKLLLSNLWALLALCEWEGRWQRLGLERGPGCPHLFHTNPWPCLLSVVSPFTLSLPHLILIVHLWYVFILISTDIPVNSKTNFQLYGI